VRDRALSNPLLVGQLVSRDGKALCLYLPLTDKLLSYRVYEDLQKKIAGFGGSERYHIAGLPVAEGAIGVEMFSEMVVATPLTMVLFFGLLYVMFRRWSIVVLPMIVSTAAVVITFGAMVGLGFPVHILSSMLPIFLMSISLCDSIHFLSEFYEVYTPEKGRVQACARTGHPFIHALHSAHTAVDSFLCHTEIPPARGFGFSWAWRLVAWLVTIFFFPAYIISGRPILAGFGHGPASPEALAPGRSPGRAWGPWPAAGPGWCWRCARLSCWVRPGACHRCG
jgi:predicted RND superfamily exporter protein